MIGDINYGTNYLSYEWFNKQFEKQNKTIRISYLDDMEKLFVYLCNKLDYKDNDECMVKELVDKGNTIKVFFKSYKQYKYFYYLVMTYEDVIIK